MTRHKGILITLISFLFLCVFVLLTGDVYQTKSEVSFYPVSVILYGNDAESYAILRQGLEQAAIDFNIDLSVLIAKTSEEQISLMQKEYENNTKAVIISAIDSEEIKTFLDKSQYKIPVVAMESEITSKWVNAFVSSNNEQVGLELGEQIKSMGFESQTIAVASANQAAAITKRYEGLRACLPNATFEPYDPGKFYGAIAALDTQSLDFVSKQIKGKMPVFGIGISSRIAAQIEDGMIQSSIVPGDYNIGYLCAQTAFHLIQNKAISASVQVPHILIHQKNMFDLENQKIIFPIIR